MLRTFNNPPPLLGVALCEEQRSDSTPVVNYSRDRSITTLHTFVDLTTIHEAVPEGQTIRTLASRNNGLCESLDGTRRDGDTLLRKTKPVLGRVAESVARAKEALLNLQPTSLCQASCVQLRRPRFPVSPQRMPPRMMHAALNQTKIPTPHTTPPPLAD